MGGGGWWTGEREAARVCAWAGRCHFMRWESREAFILAQRMLSF